MKKSKKKKPKPRHIKLTKPAKALRRRNWPRLIGYISFALTLLFGAWSMVVYYKDQPYPFFRPKCDYFKYTKTDTLQALMKDFQQPDKHPADLNEKANFIRIATKSKQALERIVACKWLLKMGLNGQDRRKFANIGFRLAVKLKLWTDVYIFGQTILNSVHTGDKSSAEILSADFYFDFANSAFRLGDFPVAFKVYDTLLKESLKKPNEDWSSQVYHSSAIQGMYFLSIGDYKRSLICFRRIFSKVFSSEEGTKSDKMYFLWSNETLFYIVKNYGRLKLEAEGLTFINDVVPKTKFPLENKYLTTLLYVNMNNHEVAERLYSELTRLDNPNDYDLTEILLSNKAVLDKIGKAITYYEHKHQDSYLEKYSHIAHAFAHKNDFPNAAEYLQLAIDMGGKDNMIFWLEFIFHEDFTNFRSTKECVGILEANKPLPNIILLSENDKKIIK